MDAFFAAKKQAVIDIVKARQCSAAIYIKNNANDYNELVDMMFTFAKTFDCDPTYLDALLAPFDDAVDLIPNGIYYNKTGLTVVNPKWIINSTGMIVTINGGGLIPELDIAYNSTVTSITVTGATRLDLLNIGGGSTVTLLTANSGSCVSTVLVKSCLSTVISTLTSISGGSCVDNIGVDEGAVFGGFECVTI